MKKQDPFSGIPAVPNSLAGQWLAFNHMANHYRKLLNVKPRVDSSAPRISGNNNSNLVQSMSSHFGYKEIQSGTSEKNSNPRKLIKKKKSLELKPLMNKNNTVICQYQYSDFMESPQSSPRVVVKKRPPRKSMDILTGADYQVVFGPSSLKSSTDALVSDCESQPEKPRVETIGVAEKIQVFLDQLHNHNNNNKIKENVPLLPYAQKSTAIVQSKQPKTTKGSLKTNAKDVDLEPRLSRHSKCFLPCDSNENSPKKVPKKKPPPAPVIGKSFQGVKLSEAINKSKMAKSLGQNGAKSTTAANIRNPRSESRGKSIMGKGAKMRYLSGGSGGSVGTIRGSDELTAEDLLVVTLPPKKVPISEGSPNSIKNLSNSLNQRNKSVLRSSSAGYCSQSLSGKATSSSSLGLINNKDSSRDSAYGFSSGESRITTRESTPEKIHTAAYHKPKIRKSLNKNNKNDKYKSALSTVASSANPCTVGGQKKKQIKDSLILDPTGDKYLNFLTDITEDIVNRGIYTNKGLKILFKAHFENHKGLDPSQMEEMLEKLRMDLGIPKDDTLNKLEFGYGSVLYTTDSYFYKKGNPTIPEKVSPSSSKGKSLSRKPEHHQIHDPNQSHENNSSFDLRENRCEGDNQSSKSEDSLSETELRLTLKEAGLDSETALEIVHIMNDREHVINSDDDESDRSSTQISKLLRTNFPLEKHRRRRQSVRSESPPSRCSTGSS